MRYEKLQYLLIFLIIIILISVVGVVYNKREENVSHADKNIDKEAQEVSISELSTNASHYMQREVITFGRLHYEGPNYYQGGNFYLQDIGDERILVDSWAPLEVAPCPPVQQCEPPKTMKTYLDHNIQVKGTVVQRKTKAYINKTWVNTGMQYVLTNIAPLADDITPIPSNADEVKTYKNEKLGFSFHYPAYFDEKYPVIVQEYDTGVRLLFKPYPNSDHSGYPLITVETSKSLFIGTKDLLPCEEVGSVAYKLPCLIEPITTIVVGGIPMKKIYVATSDTTAEMYVQSMEKSIEIQYGNEKLLTSFMITR